MARGCIGRTSLPLLGLVTCIIGATGCTDQTPNAGSDSLTVEALDEMRHPAVSPADAEATFDVADGFRMTLIASEPLVYDPVAIAYDESGRAYVAEMSDYPYTDKETSEAWEEQTDQAPIGRVRILEDTDGDGRFDTSTVFAEDLSWPTGLAVWRGGIFVTATPDVWYLKDMDDDGVADVREKVYTGFRKFNVQGVINNPRFGLDHRFYVAGASNGGTVTSPRYPDLDPVNLGRNDFRFDPVTGDFDVMAGGARFGNTWDDWGNRFICHIRNPVMHVVLSHDDLARNPFLAVPEAVQNVSSAGDDIPVFGISPPEPWRAIRARRRATDPAYAGTPASEMVATGYWTSSSGITVYRGDAYPPEYENNVFIGEVANNVIHRQKMWPDGVTFASARADSAREFVASTDTWFRGVNLVNAPDGTLHVLDMYREVIEHPWSIPDDIHAELDLLSGTDRGRIYRLEPPGFTVPDPPQLGDASTSTLVTALESLNGWERDTAHRLLYERQDADAVQPLRTLLRNSSLPVARMLALWSLEGLDFLDDEDLVVGLHDPDPRVREHAVRLGEVRLSSSDRILDRVLELARDMNVRVRLQTALSLGASKDARIPEALARILEQSPTDGWVRTAVLSSAAERSGTVLVALLDGTSGMDAVVRELAEVVGARGNRAELAFVLRQLPEVDESMRYAIAAGVGEGLSRAGSSLRETGTMVSSHVDAVMAEAASRALNDELSDEARSDALEVLAYDDHESTAGVIERVLLATSSERLHISAIRALSARDGSAQALIENWELFGAGARGEALEAFLSRHEWTIQLVAAVESGTIDRTDIGEAARIRLLRHRDERISQTAEQLFGTATSRKQAIARYIPSLAQRGDAAVGRGVFQEECAACHVHDGEGVAVGPNLGSVSHKTPEEVLVAVLDPNREVSAEYVLHEIVLQSGRTATGMIESETATSVTIKRAGGVTETILRSNISHIRSTRSSLMPVGLENSISEREMNDLISYLLN